MGGRKARADRDAALLLAKDPAGAPSDSMDARNMASLAAHTPNRGADTVLHRRL